MSTARRPSSCASAALRARAHRRVLGRPVAVAERRSEPPGLARHAGAALRAGDPAAARRRARCATGEALLAFGARCRTHAGPMINLSASGDLARGGRQPVRRAARARRRGRHRHRRHADPRAGARRGHQRPPAEGREGAMNAHARRRAHARAARSPARHRRARARADRSRPAAALPARVARHVRGPRRRGAAAGHRRQQVSKILALAHEHAHAGRAAGRQYRPRRRADPDARRDPAVGRPAEARARASMPPATP